MVEQGVRPGWVERPGKPPAEEHSVALGCGSST